MPFAYLASGAGTGGLRGPSRRRTGVVLHSAPYCLQLEQAGFIISHLSFLVKHRSQASVVSHCPLHSASFITRAADGEIPFRLAMCGVDSILLCAEAAPGLGIVLAAFCATVCAGRRAL